MLCVGLLLYTEIGLICRSIGITFRMAFTPILKPLSLDATFDNYVLCFELLLYTETGVLCRSIVFKF